MRQLAMKGRLTEQYRGLPQEGIEVKVPLSDIGDLQRALLRAVDELERLYAGE